MNWIWEGSAFAFAGEIPNDEGLMPAQMTRDQEYDPAKLARHCFTQIDPQFASTARAGDFVVGGRNFAYGNPHIQGFLGLKGLGVSLLVESMSRGPLRACVNAGVPILIAPDVLKFVATGDRLTVNFETGEIRNTSQGTVMHTSPMPEVMRDIVAAGGGIDYMKMRLKKDACSSSVS